MHRPGPRPRHVALTTAAAAVGLLLAGCAGPSSHQDVSVGGATTTTVPSATTAAGIPPTTVTGTGTTPTTAPTSTTAGAGGPAPCAPSSLRADQVPLSAGTGHFYLGWSLTDTTSSACVLAGGRPTLRFLDSGGSSIVSYTTSSLGAPGAPSLTLLPGRAVWFLTEETGSGCGVGTTVGGGPFHYAIGLPAGGTVTWTAAYLAGTTLSDFCARVPLAVGALQVDRPSAT